MSYVLIKVSPQEHDWKPEIALPGMRRTGYVITGKEYDERLPTTSYNIFEVRSEDKDAFVAEITKYHPGCDICIYELSQTAIRPAGDLVLKSVTKDGVLPS